MIELTIPLISNPLILFFLGLYGAILLAKMLLVAWNALPFT